MTLRTSSGVTAGPSASRTWLWTHCQTCERAISAVAASSIRLKMPTAAVPRSHEDRYWMATLTSLRRPSSVASPPVAATFSRSAALARTSSRLRPIWLGRSPSTASKHSIATGTRSGCATQVPSKPSPDSRCLSSRTLASATSLTSGSRRLGMNAAMPPIAGLDQQLGVGAHERYGHGDLVAVGQGELGPVPELLDDREHVVPAAGVQPGRVVAQLEGAVPQARLEMALELGQVEVRAGAVVEQAAGVVEEVEAEVHQAAGGGLAVDQHVLLGQVPAARADQQHGHLVVEPVLPALRALEGDGALDGLDQVRLAGEHVLPGRRVGVLEIGHEDLRARVERVDEHLAVGRAGDLDAAVGQVRRQRGDPPVAGAHALGGGQEAGQLTGVERLLAAAAPLQQLQPGGSQLPLERGDEVERVGRQDLPVRRLGGTVDFDSCRACHAWTSIRSVMPPPLRSS